MSIRSCSIVVKVRGSQVANRPVYVAIGVNLEGGLKGLPDAIGVTWPEATVQTCVVHLVRNGLRYASRKYWAKISGEMRDIYTAPTVEGTWAVTA